MIIPSLQGFPWLVLVISCTFNSVLNAYDITRRLKPQGPLGVTLDYSMATSWPTPIDVTSQVNRNWMWSSHITFASPVRPVGGVGGISDPQLWQIVRDAYKEMVADMAQYSIGPGRQPGAMAVLAFGNEIILASSQRGQPSYTYNYENTPVLESLKLCQIVWRDYGPGNGATDDPHRTEGKCAEVMAAHLYYSIHTNPLSSQQARVATVAKRRENLVQLNPCGDPQQVSGTTLSRGRANRFKDYWGCNLFVVAEGLAELDTSLDAAPYTLGTLAGGPAVIDQVQICSVEKISSS